jgi:HSP20 family protein
MTLVKWSNHPIFSDLFDGMDTRHNRWGFNRPAVNIKEENDGFNLEMAVPGLSKSDFNIDLEKNMLTISASRQDENVEKEDNYKRREFNYYNFSRSFTIGDKIDIDKIKAEYKDGILKVALPMKEEAKDKGPKTIKIS